MINGMTQSISLPTTLDVTMITDIIDKGNVAELTYLNVNIKYLTRTGSYQLICRKC